MQEKTKWFLDFLLEKEEHYSKMAKGYAEAAQICQDHIRFITWKESWGLEVQTDLTCDEGNEDEPYRIIWLSTEHDPAVGIFGEQLSPFFTDVDKLVDWWKGERENLDVQMQEMFE